ncbi:unnamed protein product [Dicrocoelium dendriticum]|nr:unnamed protein product [Dicrocoelium dendriticum]
MNGRILLTVKRRIKNAIIFKTKPSEKSTATLDIKKHKLSECQLLETGGLVWKHCLITDDFHVEGNRGLALLQEVSHGSGNNRLSTVPQETCTALPKCATRKPSHSDENLKWKCLAKLRCLHPLPHGTTAYTLQVAGHTVTSDSTAAILRHPTRAIIFKWLQLESNGYPEIAFYEQMYDEDAKEAFHQLRPFLPRYFGVYYTPDFRDIYLGLSDNLAAFEFPNVCDIKLGTINYRPEIPMAKKLHKEASYVWRKQLGFVLNGLMIYNPTTNAYSQTTKSYCRSLTPVLVRENLAVFLGPDPQRRARLAEAYLAKLSSLSNWFVTHGIDSLLFCRTSLLLGHEAAKKSTEVVVRLIDFTHWSEMTSSDVPSEAKTIKELTTGFSHALTVLMDMIEVIAQPSRNGS